MKYFKNTRPLIKDNIKFDYNREHNTGWFNLNSEVSFKDIPEDCDFILEYKQIFKNDSGISSYVDNLVCYRDKNNHICNVLDGSEIIEDKLFKFLRIKII